MLSPTSRLSQRKINENLLRAAMDTAPPLIPLSESDLSRTDAVTRARSDSDDSESVSSDVMTPKTSNAKNKQTMFFESSAPNSPIHESVKQTRTASEKLPIQIQIITETNEAEQEPVEPHEEIEKDDDSSSDNDPNTFLRKCVASLKLKTLTHEQHVEAMNDLHNLWVKNSNHQAENFNETSQQSVDSDNSEKSIATTQYLEQELVLLRQQSKIETDQLRKELEQEKQKALFAQGNQLQRTTSKEDEISALREEYEQEATVFMEGVRRECHEAQEKAVEAALKEQQEELKKNHQENLDEALSLQELKLKEQHDETLANALDQTRVLLQKRHSASLLEVQENLKKELEDQRCRVDAEKQEAIEEHRQNVDKTRSELISDAVAKFVEENKKLVQEHKAELDKLKKENLEKLNNQKQDLKEKLSAKAKARDEEIESLRERLQEQELSQLKSEPSDTSANTFSPKISREHSRSSRVHFDKLHRLQSEREKVLREAIGKINDTLEHKHQDQNLLLEQKVEEVKDLEEEIQRMESNHRSHVKELHEQFDDEKEERKGLHECEIRELKTKLDLAANEVRDAASRSVELEKNHGLELERLIEDHQCEVTRLRKSIDEAHSKSREVADRLAQAVDAFAIEKAQLTEGHKREIGELQQSTDIALSEGREECSGLHKVIDNLKREKEQAIERHRLEIDEIMTKSNDAVGEARLENNDLAHQMQLLAEQHSNEISRLKKSLEEAAIAADEASFKQKQMQEDFELKQERLLNQKEEELRSLRQSSDDEQVARLERLETDYMNQREKLIAEHQEELKEMRGALEDATSEMRSERKRHAHIESEFVREKNDQMEHHKSEMKKLQCKLEAAIVSSHINTKSATEIVYGKMKSDQIMNSGTQNVCPDERQAPSGKSDEEVVLAIKEAIKINEERLRREFESEISKVDKDVQQVVKKAVDERTESLCAEFQDQLRTALTAKQIENERKLEAAIHSATLETEQRVRKESQAPTDQIYLERIAKLESALEEARVGQQIPKDTFSMKSQGDSSPSQNVRNRMVELESELIESRKAWKEEKTALENRHFAKLEMFRRSHQVQLRRSQDRAKAAERSKALELANLKTEQKMTEVANTTELNLRVQDLMRKNMAESSRVEEILKESQHKAASLESQLANQQKIIEKMTLSLCNKEDELAEVRETMDQWRSGRKHVDLENIASSETLLSALNGRMQKSGNTTNGEASSSLQGTIRKVVTTQEKQKGVVYKGNQSKSRDSDADSLNCTPNDKDRRLSRKNAGDRKFTRRRDVELTQNYEMDTERLSEPNMWKNSCDRDNYEVESPAEDFRSNGNKSTMECFFDEQRQPMQETEKSVITFSPCPPRSNKKISEFKTPVCSDGSSETVSTTSETTSATRQSNASMSRRSALSESPLRTRRRIKSLNQKSSFRVNHFSEIDEPKDSNRNKSAKKNDNSTNAAEIKVLLTCPTTPLLIQMVRDLGAELIEIVDKAHMATHVVIGETLRRTPKLMIALCVTSNIVTIDWLLNSHRSNQILQSSQYLCLKDKRAEKRYNFSMKRTLYNGTSNRENGGLLNGWTVVVAKGVAGIRAPPKNELELILQATGATVVDPDEIMSVKMKNQSLVITSDPPTLEQITFVNKTGLRTATSSWLFDCVMHQKLTGVGSEV
mmetsp:Transcript_8015/g.11591  ORF Transcript_8015/g.11591 Transcript_8015/m.11591 type:complete len:1660 (+) Transcript_8015:110-5089(+)